MLTSSFCTCNAASSQAKELVAGFKALIEEGRRLADAERAEAVRFGWQGTHSPFGACVGKRFNLVRWQAGLTSCVCKRKLRPTSLSIRQLPLETALSRCVRRRSASPQTLPGSRCGPSACCSHQQNRPLGVWRCMQLGGDGRCPRLWQGYPLPLCAYPCACAAQGAVGTHQVAG